MAKFRFNITKIIKKPFSYFYSNYFKYFKRCSYTELSNTVTTLELRISRLERANLAMLKRMVQLSNQALLEMEANLNSSGLNFKVQNKAPNKAQGKTKVYLSSSSNKNLDLINKKEPTYH